MSDATTPTPVSPAARPLGVTLAALALGFASLGLLCFAGMTAFSGVMMRKAPQAAVAAGTTPGVPQPSLEMVAAFVMIFALIEASIAVWGGITVAGLLKLKQWARISILILGGLLVAGGLLFAFSSAMMPVMMKATPMPPQVNMAQMKLIFAAFALVSVGVALVGVWWLVYFLLAGTRAAFAAAASPSSAVAYVRREPTGPVTDFSVAQPLPPSSGQAPHDSSEL